MLAAHPGESQGRPKTTPSSQLIVCGGLPCHAPPESPRPGTTTLRLAPAGTAQAGISYPDNAIAEAWVATYKTELVQGRLLSFEHLEHETLRWISFYG